MSRITKAEKEKYQIDGLDRWMGKCPTCGEAFWASDHTISQASIIAAIKTHEMDTHPVMTEPGLTVEEVYATIFSWEFANDGGCTWTWADSDYESKVRRIRAFAEAHGHV